MKKEIQELIKVMQGVKKEDAEICIFHKLYGEQKLRCEFFPIVDDRIGFTIKGQDIYIEKDKINKIQLGKEICFSDDVMEIMIKIK